MKYNIIRIYIKNMPVKKFLISRKVLKPKVKMKAHEKKIRDWRYFAF